MLIDENTTVIRKYPEWITDRDPGNKELVWNEDYKYLENRFLVTRAGVVWVAVFIKYPKVRDACYGKATSRKWYKGYWEGTDYNIDGWMPLPEPIRREHV